LTRGWYLYGRFGSVDGIDNGNSFSDYGWIETELDGRIYIPVFSDKTSVALRAAANLKEPKRGSQIPFYELSLVGGTSHVRGFDTYRFRANNAVVFSGEVRQTVWSMNDENTRGLDLVAFIDVGQVWGDNRSQTNPAILVNDDFSTRNYRVGAGGGIQYRLNKTVAFRFDIAASNETTKFYFMSRPGF
jgi:outer membrane protein assembly factor BamA